MKNKQKSHPTFFTNMSDDKIDKLLNDSEETAMTKKDKKTRKSLMPEDVERMIKEWDDKTTNEWAKEFDVSYQTIIHMVKEVRKVDDKLCPQKTKKGRTRADIAKAGIALYKEKQDEK